MKLEIGKTYICEKQEWTCVDILDSISPDLHKREMYGIEPNSKGILEKSGVKIYVVIYSGAPKLWIDWFYENEKGFINSNEICRELIEIHKPIEDLPEKVREILAKNMKNGKRFVSYTNSPESNYKFIVCIDKNDVVCQYENETLPETWTNRKWHIADYTELDITFEQYLKINGFKVKSKEEEIAELEAQVIEKLGCQKEHLTPVLKSFVELMKQIKESKSTYNGASRSIMAAILNNEDVDDNWAEQKVIYNLLKKIEQKI